jgi:hypothetical protein
LNEEKKKNISTTQTTTTTKETQEIDLNNMALHKPAHQSTPKVDRKR